jgi:hypothetical protein
MAQFCQKCKIEMVVMWEEALGLMARCPCCLDVIEIHRERRKETREGKAA